MVITLDRWAKWRQANVIIQCWANNATKLMSMLVQRMPTIWGTTILPKHTIIIAGLGIRKEMMQSTFDTNRNPSEEYLFMVFRIDSARLLSLVPRPMMLCCNCAALWSSAPGNSNPTVVKMWFFFVSKPTVIHDPLSQGPVTFTSYARRVAKVHSQSDYSQTSIYAIA